MPNTYDGPLKDKLAKWIKGFRKSEFAFEGYDQQLAGFLTKKLQATQRPTLLNPKAPETWKHCSLCGTPMDPQYDKSGEATSGNNCCGR